MAQSSFAIGIDLGTTYSCAAVFLNDNVETIRNELGELTTASRVSFTDEECIVGTPADDAACTAKNKIYDSKRMLGRSFEDKELQKDIAKNWNFDVLNVSGKPKLQIQRKGRMESYTPEDISAKILAKLKQSAVEKLNGSVDKAVITIPAYFNNSQRQATIDAAKIAGFEVLRLLHEPFAAAMAYGLGKKYEIKGTILVYDLGGGTLDVSILKVDGGNFEVVSTNGNTHLGGQDFTNRLCEHVIKEFKERKKVTIQKDRKDHIFKQCEYAKRMLSTMISYNVQYFGAEVLTTTVRRATFEEINRDLFLSTLSCIDDALRDAELGKSDIDEVVLTGGSTRIPYIRQIVAEYFEGKKLNTDINVDEAVAHGAAIQAAILCGDKSAKLQSLVATDITPLSLGVETNIGDMTVVVKRNSKIPLRKSHRFTTKYDNQTSAKFAIYEGERVNVKENTLLGSFTLQNIPLASRGVPSLTTEFVMNNDGILTVTAVDKATGNSESIKIERGGQMSQLEIDECLEIARRNKMQDEEVRSRQAARNELESYVYTIKSEIQGVTRRSSEKIVLNKCVEILKWITTSELADIKTYNQKKTELESILGAN